MRKYIEQIKNKDIRNIQELLYARYIKIEDVNIIKSKTGKNKNLIKLQKQSEYKRDNHYTEKEIVKRHSVYFGPELDKFEEKLSDFIERSTTKKPVKTVFFNFQLAVSDIPSFFLHLMCTILGKVDYITLTNCRIQMRNLLEKNYILLSAKDKSGFTDATIKKSGWYQLSDMIIRGLEEAKIVEIDQKLGPRKRKYTVDYIGIFSEFKSIAITYDYKSTNMPLFTKPKNWESSANHGRPKGGFLFHQKDLIMYNKEKSLMTNVSDEILSNINFLQNISYKINKKRLKQIESNFNQYLKKQGIRIHLYKNKQDFLEEDYKFNHNHKIYNDQLKKVCIILETLEQALYLSNFSCFYFTIYLDFRTRIYYHGWPINPQGSSLSRELIMFGNQRKKSLTKELDVSASGLQIIGGLLGNFDYLEKTNLLIKKNKPKKKKYDIYLETLNKYLLQKSFNNENHETFIRKFFSRKVFKSIIMCYFYNETHFGVVKKLESLGFEKEFKIHDEVTLIRNFLKKEFEDYEILSRIINQVIYSAISNQKVISLYKGNVETFQYYALQETIQVDYYDHRGKRQKIRVSIDKDPLCLDTRKTRRATLPNFIHNLDSQLLHSVVRKAQKHNINLSVIHDCFIVHKNHESKLKKWYFEAFNDLILSENNSVLLSFIERNLSEIENKNLKEDLLKTLKKKDFSEILRKNYRRSPYILS